MILPCTIIITKVHGDNLIIKKEALIFAPVLHISDTIAKMSNCSWDVLQPIHSFPVDVYFEKRLFLSVEIEQVTVRVSTSILVFTFINHLGH